MNVTTSRWLIGYVGTWFILSAMTEANQTADLAAALAISVAFVATIAFGVSATRNLFKEGATA